MIRGLAQDLLHATRTLRKAKSFTVVCVVSLGIGMAPVIAVPYASRMVDIPPAGLRVDGLVELVTTLNGAQRPTSAWSYPDFVDLRQANTGMSLTGWVAGQSKTSIQTPTGTESSSVSTLFVSPNYFETMGVTLARGGGFPAATNEPAVILGYDFWKNHQAADPAIVGKTIALDGTQYLVAGIAPEGFTGHIGLQREDLFVPLEQHPDYRTDEKRRLDRKERWLYIQGRLEPGVSISQASAAVASVTAELARQHPATNEGVTGAVEAYYPIGALARRNVRLLKTVALTITGAILLVVCLNISGMMRVRGALRERELSIRQAIGASRWRLVRYLLAESIVLAGLGTIIAASVLFNLPSLVSRLTNQPLPYALQQALRIDVYIIAICGLVCLVTSLVFGLLPALRFSRPVILSSLKDDAGGGSLRVGRIHRVTAALQVAIAVPLLVMGAISLDRVRSTAMADLGFDAELLYAAPLLIDPAKDTGFQIRAATASLATTEGVAAVTVADGLPLDFRYRMRRVSFQAKPDDAPRFVSAQVTRVGDAYLEAMGIRLLRGRGFTGSDAPGAPLVTVISEPLAHVLFPNTDAAEAIGKQIKYGEDPANATTLTIVGITNDFPSSQMSNPREQLLLPLAQYGDVRRDSVAIGSDTDETPRLMLIARSRPGEQPDRMTAAVERIARDFDREFQSSRVVTGAGLRKNSMDDFLTQSFMGALTGGVILLLSALGIYGVVGLMVATRTREIAVRVAIGATRRRVIGMILFDVVKLVTPGVAIGVVLTVALNKLNAENMGVSLSQIENVSYVVGGAIAVLVAVLASLGPARRAASVAPMVAMRSL